MALTKGVFLDLASIHPSDLDLSGLQNTLPEWQLRDNTHADDIASVLSDVEVAVVNKVMLNADNLSAASKLKLICAAATGVNNIDLVAAKDRGIVVCNARAYATASVVQHVFALLLSLTTKLDQYQQDVYSGHWSSSEFFCLLDHPVRELNGLTMGIVGYGELGRAVASLAQAFGMQVLVAKRNANDQREGRLDLDALLPEVDVLSLHCPLTEDNRGFIGARELALMKHDAVLINTARGGLVDESALLNALRQNLIGGAGLDVIEREPPPANYPLLQERLPNLIITPHTAWSSRNARQAVVQEVVRNIEAFLRGEPRNQVN